MGVVSSPITLFAVAHRAVRHVDLTAELDVPQRGPGGGSPHGQAAGDEAERSPTREVYSSTTNWPTT